MGLAVLALFGCNYIPRTVEGVPAEAPWAALPLRGWLVEGPVAPEAMTICRPPECRPGLAVAVLDVAGPDADEAEAVLRRPAGLARALSGPGGKPRKIETIAEASPLAESGAEGFLITLRRKDGSKPPAYGAALGRRDGAALRIVLVIGENADAVEATARRVAREHLHAEAVVSRAPRPYGDTAPRTATKIPEGPPP